MNPKIKAIDIKNNTPIFSSIFHSDSSKEAKKASSPKIKEGIGNQFVPSVFL